MAHDISHAQQVIDLVASLVAKNTPHEQLCATVHLLFKGLFAAESASLKAATPAQLQKLCEIANDYADADTLAAMVAFQYRAVPKSVDHVAAVAGVIDMMAGLNQLDPDSAAGALQSLIEIAANYRKLTAADIDELTSACARYSWIKVPPLAAAAPPSPPVASTTPKPTAAATSLETNELRSIEHVPSAPSSKPVVPPCRLVTTPAASFNKDFSEGIIGFVRKLDHNPDLLNKRDSREMAKLVMKLILALETNIDTPTLGELAAVIRDVDYRFGAPELQRLMDDYDKKRFETRTPCSLTVHRLVMQIICKASSDSSTASCLELAVAAIKLLTLSSFDDFSDGVLDCISCLLSKLPATTLFNEQFAVKVNAWIKRMKFKNTMQPTESRKRKRDNNDNSGPDAKRAC